MTPTEKEFFEKAKALEAARKAIKSSAPAQPLPAPPSPTPLAQVSKPRSKKLFLLLGVPVLLIAVVYAWNYFSLQAPMNKVLRSDERNSGIEVNVHYGLYVEPGTIVYDLQSVSGKAPVDVIRVLFQFATELKRERFDTIILSAHGDPRFQMRGADFQELGEKYGTENAVYQIRTLPEHILDLNGHAAFSKWEGGLLGVVSKQMEDVTEFVKQWSR